MMICLLTVFQWCVDLGDPTVGSHLLIVRNLMCMRRSDPVTDCRPSAINWVGQPLIILIEY